MADAALQFQLVHAFGRQKKEGKGQCLLAYLPNMSYSEIARQFPLFRVLTLVPLVEFNLLQRLDVRNEGLERLRVGLEQLEEGDHADGLEVPLDDGPAGADRFLLLLRQHPVNLKMEGTCYAQTNCFSSAYSKKRAGERASRYRERREIGGARYHFFFFVRLISLKPWPRCFSCCARRFFHFFHVRR